MSRDRATDILDVLSVTGGVSRYLEEVNPALPAARVANPCKMGLSWGLVPKLFIGVLAEFPDVHRISMAMPTGFEKSLIWR